MSEKERMIASGYEFAVDMAMEWAYDREEAKFWMGMIVGLGAWAKAVTNEQLGDDMKRIRAEVAKNGRN